STIGAKRNFACVQAKGEIIVNWDDDDWYSPHRVAYQTEPIRSGQADLTGLPATFTLQLPAGAFWTICPELHKRMFVGDIPGGTLAYRRQVLTAGVRYPDVSLAEDASFLQLALDRGFRLQKLDNPGVFIYVRHGRNTWSEYSPGRFLDPQGWDRIDPPAAFS